MIEKLIEEIKKYNPKGNFELIKKAYQFASQVHKNHKRLSGDSYIAHPFAVAEILVELEQDATTIAAALLHDVIEDGEIKREEIAEKFGEEIARLVEGVTKLGQLVFESREERQAENFRKMFLAMGEDIRIVIIKLADRLHNMRTIKYLPAARIKETSLETKEIFSPLAHRLGMWKLKWELEDLAFRRLEPAKFKEIKTKVADTREEREAYLKDFINAIKTTLKKVGIAGEIYGRPKHFHSIYRKMVEQNLEFEELYDLLALRILVPSIKECYAALGIIHAAWKPIPGRFRDYIAMPKSNGYQSLHTTVIGPNGKPIEIQIRTPRMHRIAEYGVAAHWRYKEGETDKGLDKKMAWLRQMLEWQSDMEDAKDFMESLKIDLFTDEVFVFTPKGAVFDLPVESTPVDFAYRVHTEVGHRCMGAKVNGRIVSLDYKLKNGDIVEIIAGKTNNPSLDWLNFVKTSQARTKIRSWFKKQKKEENIKRGKEILYQELKKMHLDTAELAAEVDEDTFAAIGYGEKSAYQAAKALRLDWHKRHGVPLIEEEAVRPFLLPKKRGRKKERGILVAGLSNVLTHLSRCCRPIPGEEIVGFVTKGKGVTIHRQNCANVVEKKLPKEKIVKVEWNPKAEITYPVEIEVEAFDRVGVLKDILGQIAETETNVSAANITTKRGSTAFLRLIIDMRDTNHLDQVLAAIRKVKDVYEVRRK